MSQFLSNLVTECIDDLSCEGRGIWEIREPFLYYSDILKDSVLVEVGFLTDFASVPRLPFVFTLLGDTAHKAAVVHDWLYHHHEVCGEDTANKVFLEACSVEGISKWRSILLFLGVWIGGHSSWDEDGNSSGHIIVDGRII